jgi:hypothetical protein
MRTAQNGQIATVPNAIERTGNFSATSAPILAAPSTAQGNAKAGRVSR